jgi:hypothetical protein
MGPIVPNLAALSVAVLFYVWRACDQVRRQRERTLRERVAYMLWVMAEQMTGSDSQQATIPRG